jgi:hypothetical protein
MTNTLLETEQQTMITNGFICVVFHQAQRANYEVFELP